MSVSYKLKPVNPQAHLFEIELSASSLDPEGQIFRLPNWIPGSYMIRDFSKNIVQMTAVSNGAEVELEKLDKSTWRTPAGLESVTLSYTVHAWDLSVRTAHLDDEHGFFNGTSVFLSVAGQENTPHDVELIAPADRAFSDWQLASTLPAVDVKESGFGRYRAADYDELIDHPVEMGTFERIEFDACGCKHEVVLTGSFHTDHERIARDLKIICEAQIRFFGEPAPVDRYVFMVMVVGDGYGGLEHRASTALLITREHLPVVGDSSVNDKYLSFLGLCSHEYFHTWNVKRIKPARFVPFELEAESHTRLLWFFEGITSYYDDLFLVRTGLITTEQYCDLMAKTITRVRRGSGRLVQSVTDSSFDAWNKFYKQDANAPNAIVSYYAKGALVSLCLDAEIRQASNGEKSLDDLMRLLWVRWLDNQAGLGEREPEQLASEIAGKDLSDFFQHALYTTEDLPIDEALESLGVNILWRARKSVSDTGGGKPGEGKTEESDEESTTESPWLGANVDGGLGKVGVTHVLAGGAAEQAGLAPGDTIIALDNILVSAGDIPDLLKRYASAEQITLHYSRHGVLKQAELPVQTADTDTCSLVLASEQVPAWLSTLSL